MKPGRRIEKSKTGGFVTIICHCRGISVDSMTEAFKNAKEKAPDKDVALEDLAPDLGTFVCGGCTRIFERAAEQFNENGEINIFRRSRKSQEQGSNGLCSKAMQTEYTSGGVPDLLSSPIEGTPKTPAV